MPKQYAVTELQTVEVVYYVNADNEDMAKEHVRGLYCDEYDVVNGVKKSEIINVCAVEA
jgi:hypothetical protein